ncbi:MAG: hypothetical protein ACREOU_01045 [Candidatus Eiseniibacteriota bacterium]
MKIAPRFSALLAGLTLASGFASNSIAVPCAPPGCGPPGFPCAATSIVPAAVVGDNSGAPINGSPAPVPPGCGIAPVPGYVVQVFDALGAPVVGVPVTLNFFATGTRLHVMQNAGTAVACLVFTLTVPTNACGVAVFSPRVGSFNNGAVVAVMAAGVCLGNARVTSTDLDGLGGTTGLADLGLFASNFIGAPAAVETDFDDNGITGLGDFGIFAREFLSGAVGAYCF